MSTSLASNHPHVLAPSAPRSALPAHACDAHAHVFGPYARFPLPPGHTYAPPEAPVRAYLQMLDRVGFARGVLVHASAYAFDCSALCDALLAAPNRLRGVAVANASTEDATLEAFRRAGVRGLRFSEFSDPAAQARFRAAIRFDQLEQLAPRMRALGLHAQVWADCASFVEAAPRLLALDLPLVLDHMGYFSVERGVTDANFQRLLSMLGEGQIWVKLSANRNSKQPPAYEDVRPFHDALLERNPGRLLWGSDWPFLSMGDATPDVGRLIDLLDAWTCDAGLREQIFVTNPTALYGFVAD